MKKYILENHAGHKFPQEGKNLYEAKVNLCKRLGYPINCNETGVKSIRKCG